MITDKRIFQANMQSIFRKAQDNSSVHQKYLKRLMELFDDSTEDEFTDYFTTILYNIFKMPMGKNTNVIRLLNFAAIFCATLAKRQGDEDDSHPFLSAVFTKILELHNEQDDHLRYHVCHYITLVLQHIGSGFQLNNDLCDQVQDAMLERVEDFKVPIRLKAVAALVRLQDTSNRHCPVIGAYLRALMDQNAGVRREVTQLIAVTAQTLPRIEAKLRDVDAQVRAFAFRRIADTGPKVFSIASRTAILARGFYEGEASVRRAFEECLLPKWLTAFNGRTLDMVGALKLMTTSEEAEMFSVVAGHLIGFFYSTQTLPDLIEALPLDPQEKVLDLAGNAGCESVLYWNRLVSLLRDDDNMEEYLEQVIPELTKFCAYIEKVVEGHSRSSLDEWKMSDNNFILYNLLEILENYDLSDEAGRRVAYNLTKSVLQHNRLPSRIVDKLVGIGHKCSTDIDSFTLEMCGLISDIREPLEEAPMTEHQIAELEFKLAQANIKLNVLADEKCEAIDKQDFHQAQVLHNEIQKVTRARDQMLQSDASQRHRRPAPAPRDDVETLCHCLDLYAATLSLPAVTRLSAALISAQGEFVAPLMMHRGGQVHWRVLKCLSLAAVVDRTVAEQYAEVLVMPVGIYRTIEETNVAALVASVRAVADLLRLYGPELFGSADEGRRVEEDGDGAAGVRKQRRTLYDDESHRDPGHAGNVTFGYILEILIDMLDDVNRKVREASISALYSLIDFDISPTVFTRILLKWYNPLTAKQDGKLQIELGLWIQRFSSLKSSRSTIRQALIPTLATVAMAPKSSPLADIDDDNMIALFRTLLDVNNSEDPYILALSVCMKIREETRPQVVPLLMKFLATIELDVPPPSHAYRLEELIDRGEEILDDVGDRSARRRVEKFLGRLKKIQSDVMRRSGEDDGGNTPSSTTIEGDGAKATPQVKRKRKSREDGVQRTCTVMLEQLHLSQIVESHDSTVLRTIVEESMEIDKIHDDDDDIASETPTTSTNSSQSTRKSSRARPIVQETSDSDNSSGSSRTRRSKRIRTRKSLKNPSLQAVK